MKLGVFKDIDIVFAATSAGAHKHHNEVLQRHGVQVIDLTPAAIGQEDMIVDLALDLLKGIEHERLHAEPTMSEAA